MTHAEVGGEDNTAAIPGRSGLGTSESVAYRLWLMIELTGRDADQDGTIELLAERLSRVGQPIRPRAIRAHLRGTVVPSAPELGGYATACEWFENNALLATAPEQYLKPLIQAEVLLCTTILSPPMARGRTSAHGLDAMSVAELRAYRAELLTTGRLAFTTT